VQDTISECQVLLGYTLGQPGRPQHRARLLDHFVVGELLAGQVYLGSIRKAIPPVDSLPTAINLEHLGHQQFAAEQVIDDQRSRPTLAAGRVRSGPVTDVHRITGIACPGGTHRGLDASPRDGSHAYMLATSRACRMTSLTSMQLSLVRMLSGMSERSFSALPMHKHTA
jgi:hypothetical protein